MSRSGRRRKAVAALGVTGFGVAAGATTASANNFGSSPNDGIYMLWQHTRYSVFGSAATNELAYQAIEGLYEPLDLTVTRRAQSTDTDVNIVETTTGGYRAVCRTDVATFVGSHHHRVCNKKKIELNTAAGSDWAGWNNDQRRYVLAHEFGHAVGLRHSNQGSGTNDTGGYVTLNHPAPSETVMMTFGFGKYQLHLHDVAHIQDHY